MNKLAIRLMIEATRLIIAVAKLIFSLSILTSCSLLTVYIITDSGYNINKNFLFPLIKSVFSTKEEEPYPHEFLRVGMALFYFAFSLP